MWMAHVAIWTGSLTTVAFLVGLLQAHAGRPLVTDDADPVALGRIEVEAGVELETSTQS